MKAAIINILLLATLACGRVQVATPPPAPIALAAISWNMNAGRGDLPRLVADLESGLLAAVSPANYVLLLQEAVDGEGHHLPALARAKGLSTFFVPIWHDGRVMRGNAVVSTTMLTDAREIVLPQERQPRRAVVANITVADQRLFVVSAHLENRVSWLKGGLLSDTARGRQAEALLRALPVDEPGILGGDLNTWLGENEPAWRAFRRRFADTPPDDHIPAPTFRDRLALDHLFFDLPPGWTGARRVIPDKYGSDHHPVMAVFWRSYGRIAIDTPRSATYLKSLPEA